MILQNPKSLEESDRKVVWVQFTPYKIQRQSVGGKRGGVIKPGERGNIIKLLLPETFMYDLGHSWGSYESMSTRLLSKIGEIYKMRAEGDALVNVGKGIVNTVKNINTEEGMAKAAMDTAINSARSVQAGLGSAGVVTSKIDTPLVFEGSNRRTIALEFDLTTEKNAKTEVYDIVKAFELYSCAESIDEVLMNPPYMFEIKSLPGEVIKINKAVLTAVQPTWNYPYDENGYPFSCKLTLSFTDMSPLFRSTVEHGEFKQIVTSSME